MTFNSEEVNFLVYRYLEESGFRHTAYTFGFESNVLSAGIDGSSVPRGALVSLLQKAVLFAEAEVFSLITEADLDTRFEKAIGSMSVIECTMLEDRKWRTLQKRLGDISAVEEVSQPARPLSQPSSSGHNVKTALNSNESMINAQKAATPSEMTETFDENTGLVMTTTPTKVTSSTLFFPVEQTPTTPSVLLQLQREDLNESLVNAKASTPNNSQQCQKDRIKQSVTPNGPLQPLIRTTYRTSPFVNDSINFCHAYPTTSNTTKVSNDTNQLDIIYSNHQKNLRNVSSKTQQVVNQQQQVISGHQQQFCYTTHTQGQQSSFLGNIPNGFDGPGPPTISPSRTSASPLSSHTLSHHYNHVPVTDNLRGPNLTQDPSLIMPMNIHTITTNGTPQICFTTSSAIVSGTDKAGTTSIASSGAGNWNI